MDQQGQGYIYPGPPIHIAGHATNFQPPNVRTMMAASSSNANYDTHHLPDRHENGLFYGTVQYNGVHHHHHHHHNFYPFVSHSSGIVLPVNHGALDQLPSSSGCYGVVGSSAADEFGRSSNSITHFVGPCKSKVVPESGVQGYHHHFNASGAPISSVPLMNSSRHPDGVSMADPASFSMPPYNTGNGNLPIMHDHHNHLGRGNFTGQQHFQQSGVWLEQQHLGSSSSGDGGALAWTQPGPSMPFVHGGSLGVAPMEAANVGIPMQHDSVRSSQTMRHAPSVNHRHQAHLASSSSSSPPVVRPREHSNNLTATSHRTYSNLSRITRNSAHNGLEIGHRHAAGAVQPTGIRIYRPHRGLGSSDVALRNQQLAQLRYLHADEVAILEIPEYYELGDYTADHHSDMRLDIEDMSYEELLALGERIGSVNTGVSEEIIASKLKTVSYLSRDMSVNLEEAHCCIICQDNYKNFESVGVLDCGHDYHAECLKKWLVIKNVCPICKSEAISTATITATTTSTTGL